MTLARSKYAVLGLAVLIIMSFLYIKTQAVDLDEHNQMLNHISHFKQADAVLNQHILEIRQGLLPYYDPTVSNMAELGQLQAEMAEMLHNLCVENSALITQRLEAVGQILALKREQLESFKSSNALRRNSLRYLPIATAQIAARIPPGERGDALRKSLNALLLNVLIYNTTSDTDLAPALTAGAERLRQESQHASSKVQRDLIILLTHVDIVLKNKTETDALVQELVTLPLAQSMDELQAAYLADHDRMMQVVNTYRLALYGFSVLLLGYIGYILFRLNQAAATLRRTNADLNYQKFAMDQHAIVSIIDKAGRITYANQKFCDISGYSKAELVGQTHRIIKSDHHSEAFFKDMWDTLSRGDVWHGQVCNRARSGRHYWVESTITPFVDDNGIPYQYVAIRTDITDIKHAEAQLRVQAAALETAANGIVITDRKGTIQWVNKAFSAMTGYSRDEAMGQTPSLLKSDQQGPEFYQDMWETILTGQVWHGELLNQRKDGSLYTEEQTISPVYDEQDEISHFIAIKQDVSDRRQMEEALRRSQKMEAIGQLSGGIAHDFNNQLGIIVGYLDFLRGLFAEGETARQWVDTASKATLRCTTLTRQLLTFSRRKGSDRNAVDIGETLTGMETMIARSVTPEVEVQYFLADALWPSEINGDEFQDAILNLVINARDAMPDGGKLLFEACNKSLDADYVALNPGIAAGDYVQLSLSDTGCGMDKDTLEHVFEPFFTTKPEGKGTGLGMAMVYGFVRRYEGSIKIYSEPGMGTTIRLYLPRSSAGVQSLMLQTDTEAESPTGTETILIVDDEADLLQLAEHYLRQLGYHTRSAGNAAQARAILQQDPSIDLLFSDVVMPGDMNGYELAQLATQQRPALKVLLTSGFTSKTISHNGLARFSAHLLNKPYRKAELAQRLRLVLDETEAPPTETLATEARPKAAAAKDRLAACTVLVVDDEKDIRDLFMLNLQKMGCKAIPAGSGEEAIACYRASLQSTNPIDIIILDLSLSDGLGGKAAAGKIRALDPHAKLIVASGHTEGPEMSDCQAHGFDAALEKNFDRKHIKRVLEQVLSAS